MTHKLTVADELAFAALPEEVKELAKRVLFVDVDTAYEDGYDSGFNSGYEEGCMEEGRRALKERSELREQINNLEDEITLLKLPPLP